MLVTCHVEPFPVVWLMNCGARWTSVLFVHVLFSGLYSNGPGAWSLIVMLTVAEVEPPLLLAQTVYVTGLVCRTVGIPQIVPLLVPKFSPDGKVALISQDVIPPGPVKVALSGKSLLWLPLVSTSVLGE